MLTPSLAALSLASLVAAVAFYFIGTSQSFPNTQATTWLDGLLQNPLGSKPEPELTKDAIPWSTRVHWMRQANAVLSQLSTTPCPFAPFGTVIVNHTSDASGLGELVCMGLNAVGTEGNPTLHGEIAAINNCTTILTDPSGRYKLSSKDALAAYRDLSLYTNGEPCPMCASAIRWAGFKECIYGTSIDTAIARGWAQIDVSSHEIFNRSSHLPGPTRLIEHVLANETDPLFSWQFDTSYPCPVGCARDAGGSCALV